MSREEEQPPEAESGRFRLDRVLGRGAQGIVYDAVDLERGQRVALKKLTDPSPAAVYRFKQEFRSISQLVHPNVVRVHELLCVDGDWYITMDAVEGEDFIAHVRGASPASGNDETELIRRAPDDAAPAPRPEAPATGRLDEGRLRAALRQLVAGITALHAAGRVHRDLKPSNIRAGGDGHVTILDFGLALSWDEDDARVVGRTLESAGDLLGTPIYMAPEQASGVRSDAASDWYAVGVILFQALTGRPPFTGEVIPILTRKQDEAAPDPRTLVAELPDDLCELCLRLLEREPEARPGPAEIAAVVETLPVESEERPAQAGRLVGREADLAVLEEALATTRGGEAAVVHLRGPSGIGKTMLASTFLREAAARHGALVLRGRCFERESVPYRAIDTFIDDLLRHLVTLPRQAARRLIPPDAGALARIFPVLAAAPAFAGAREPATRDPRALRRHAFAALRLLLGRLAERRPVVIHLDDLQWGDRDSAELISEVLRSPGSPSVLLVVSYREEDAGRSPVVEAAAALGQVINLALQPLGRGAAVQLARELLGERGRLDEDAVEWIARESEGSPFFVQELARHAAASVSRPTSLAALLHEGIAGLPADPRRLVEVIATAAGPLRLDVAASAAGLSPAAAGAAVAALREASLVRTRGAMPALELEIFHDRIRASITEALSPPALRQRHAAIAEALLAVGWDDAATVAMHLRAAGDDARAAEQSERAARRATEALAFDDAVSSLRMTLELAPPGERRRLRILLGEALANAGKSLEAADAFLAAADGDDGDGDAPPADAGEETLALHRSAAAQLLRGGHLDAGAEVIRAALARAGLPYARTPRRALASLLWLRARLRLRGLAFTPRPPETLDRRVAARLDLCWAAGQGLGYTDIIRGLEFQTRHLLLALDAGDPYRVVRGLATEAMGAAATGDVARAGALVARAAELRAQTGRPEAEVWVELGAGVTAVCAYRWARARETLERVPALAAGHEAEMRWELSTAQYFGLLALLYGGEVGEVARRVPEILVEARDRGDLYTQVTLGTYPHPWYLLTHDQPDEAQRVLDEAMGLWTYPGVHLQHVGQLAADGEIALYRGHAERGLTQLLVRWKGLEQAQLLRTRFLGVRARELRGRLAIASARSARDPLLAEAERLAGWLAASGGGDWPEGLAALLRGLVAWKRGDQTRGLAQLGDAETRLRENGAALHAASVRRRRGLCIRGEIGASLVASADAELAERGVRAPAAYAAMLAPL